MSSIIYSINNVSGRRNNFIKNSLIRHSNKYIYDLVDYVNVDTKVDIICPKHGPFPQTPRAHLRGRGCNQCAVERSMIVNTKTQEQFIKECKEVHGEKYDYSKTVYVNARSTVIITCKVHGDFPQRASAHTLQGYGCKKCSIRLSQEEFIERSDLLHKGYYDYSKVYYTKGDRKVIITCPKHGDFEQKAESHLQGVGCPACYKGNSSKISVLWLERIMERKGIYIRHAKNEGEYIVPNTKMRIDGYCEQTNTIYEFYGDVFHGNPKIFKESDKCHPYKKKITAGELYKRTIEREQKIRELGYNLVTIWESDFKEK